MGNSQPVAFTNIPVSSSALELQTVHLHWSGAGYFVFPSRTHLVTVCGSSEWFLIK